MVYKKYCFYALIIPCQKFLFTFHMESVVVGLVLGLSLARISYVNRFAWFIKKSPFKSQTTRHPKDAYVIYCTHSFSLSLFSILFDVGNTRGFRPSFMSKR